MVVSNVPSLACRLLSNLLPLTKPRRPSVKVKLGDCEESYCKVSPILNSMHERRWVFSKNFWKKPTSQPEKTADISRCHQRFPRKMTSEERVYNFHTDDASLPRSEWLKQISHTARPIRSTTQIWELTRQKYGISQTSFRGETSGGITKWRLISQATYGSGWSVLTFGKRTKTIQSFTWRNGGHISVMF